MCVSNPQKSYSLLFIKRILFFSLPFIVCGIGSTMLFTTETIISSLKNTSDSQDNYSSLYWVGTSLLLVITSSLFATAVSVFSVMKLAVPTKGICSFVLLIIIGLLAFLALLAFFNVPYIHQYLGMEGLIGKKLPYDVKTYMINCDRIALLSSFVGCIFMAATVAMTIPEDDTIKIDDLKTRIDILFHILSACVVVTFSGLIYIASVADIPKFIFASVSSEEYAMKGRILASKGRILVSSFGMVYSLIILAGFVPAFLYLQNKAIKIAETTAPGNLKDYMIQHGLKENLYAIVDFKKIIAILLPLLAALGNETVSKLSETILK